MRRLFALAFGLLLLVGASPSPAPHPFRVRENLKTIYVDTSAPYPPEVDGETQARALARDAAVALAQNELLVHVLKKKTRSGKTLAEAEIPSVDLQGEVRALVRGARVEKTVFRDKVCFVRLAVDKKNLKVVLRKA